MPIGLFVGLTVASGSAAALEVVGKKTRGEQGKNLQQVSSVFQEATAAFGMLAVSVGFAYGGRSGAAAIAAVPTVLFGGIHLFYRTSDALAWGVVTPVAEKVHIVERNLAKLTNVFLGLFAVQMTHSRSLQWKAFSSLIAVASFSNIFPWFVREVDPEEGD